MFYQCTDGVARTKLCPDGLVFDPTIRKINKCDQPFNVDCGDRTELRKLPTRCLTKQTDNNRMFFFPEQPKSNHDCPRRNGFFAHPDPTVCNIFFNCIEGDATEQKCTVGLWFDEYTGNCVWPETSNREGCVDATKKTADGFECPKSAKVDSSGLSASHPKYAHPTDCQKFYVCLNNIEPRDLGCQIGEVYNEETERCDAPENVPGCEDWYKDAEDKKN